jgi:acyl carrier protein
VFPELNGEEIVEANSDSARGWDSVAGVTLLAVVEEEFGIKIEDEDLTRFSSFKGFLSYLQETSTDRLLPD